MATISAAMRICEELEVQVGTFVGHVTRFEDGLVCLSEGDCAMFREWDSLGGPGCSGSMLGSRQISNPRPCMSLEIAGPDLWRHPAALPHG